MTRISNAALGLYMDERRIGTDQVREQHLDLAYGETRFEMLRSQYSSAAFDSAAGSFRERVGCPAESGLVAVLGETAPGLLARGLDAPWEGRLEDILARFSAPVDDDGGQTLQGAVTLLARPFVSAQRSQIRGEVEAALAAADVTGDHLYTPAFEESLVAGADSDITRLLTPTVVLEINVLAAQMRCTATEAISEFCRRVRTEWISEFFSEYARLGRLLVETAHAAARFRSGLVRHLVEDRARICDELGLPHDSVFDRVGFARGDRHAGGRTVCLLTTVDGHRIVYKPRAMGVDVAFADFLAWISSGLRRDLRAARTVTGPDHGWQEFIEHVPCESSAQWNEFYRDSGILLALGYVLGTTDLHFENVVASGAMPVLVDLETLLHPDPSAAPTGPGPVSNGATDDARTPTFSVLDTGLLPLISGAEADEDVPVDFGGLANTRGRTSLLPARVVTAQPERLPEVREEIFTLDGAENVPFVTDADAVWHEFDAEILDGFERAYRFLVDHRSELLGPDGWLGRFRGERIRVVPRPTTVYAQSIEVSLHPDFMRDALEVERLFGFLWQFPNKFAGSIHWSEREQLRRLDVPYFWMELGERDVRDHDGRVVAEAMADPLDSAERRLRSMGDRDLERQLWYLRSACVCGTFGYDTQAWVQGSRRVAPVPPPDTGRSGPESSEAALARRLVDFLIMMSDDGDGADWLGLTSVDDKYWKMVPAGDGFYSGLSGIAFALLYLGRALDRPDVSTLAIRAGGVLAPRLLTQCSDGGRAAAGPGDAVVDIGLFGPVGGTLYFLAHLGALFPEAVDDQQVLAAVEALDERTDEEFAGDVIAGSAGLVRALLAWRTVGHRTDALDALIRKHVDRLLRRRIRVGDDAFAWVESHIEQAPLVGYSHGTSGIVAALAAAQAVLDDEAVDDAIRGGLAFEREMRKRFGCWPDLRTSAPGRPSTPMAAWCHGAPGVTVARAELLAHERVSRWGEESIRADAESALHETLSALARRHGPGLVGSHCLCHGQVGNLEAVHAASAVGLDVGAVDVGAVTRRLFDEMDTGRTACGVPAGVATPGYMTGIAGIATGVLRMSPGFRGQVPSALTGEAPRCTPPAAGR